MGPGFIHDELDLKVLLLYIMSRAEGPVDFAALTELALCDDGIDYFSFAQGAQELVTSGHLALADGVYAITDKGRANLSVMETSLSGVVRARCDKTLHEFNAQARRRAQVTAQTTHQDSGRCQVELGLSDGEGQLFSLTLMAPSEEQGREVAQRFKDRPEAIFSAILAILTRDGES